MPSVARLRFGNDGFRICVDPLKLPLTPILVLNFVDVNRKYITPAGGLPVSQDSCQTMWSSASRKLCESVPNQRINDGMDRRGGRLQPPDVLEGFRIELVGDNVIFTVNEALNGIIQSATMFIRTNYFGLDSIKPGPIGGIYARGFQEHSKDSEGARNSRAHKGRVRDKLRQGGEAGEEITGSPPEEGLTRTSPDHHPDGCIAKHTHSGNPEDA